MRIMAHHTSFPDALDPLISLCVFQTTGLVVLFRKEGLPIEPGERLTLIGISHDVIVDPVGAVLRHGVLAFTHGRDVAAFPANRLQGEPLAYAGSMHRCERRFSPRCTDDSGPFAYEHCGSYLHAASNHRAEKTRSCKASP